MTPHDTYQTLTPVAAPAQGTKSYHLKEWTEADALEMIHALELYAHDNDVPAPARGRWNFTEAYTWVRLALQEMELRFPAMGNQEQFKWHEAMVNAILGDGETDHWLVTTLANYLNEKLFGPAQLNAALREDGFKVAEQLPAPNLFGDGQEAQVYRIDTQDTLANDGLIVAIEGKADGGYRVEPVWGEWDFEDGQDHLVEVKDHTRNGIPQLIVERAAASGSMCESELLSFEWQGDHFAELTRGQISSYGCMDWSFVEPDEQGIEAISIGNMLPGTNAQIYRWNGSYYALSELRGFVPSTCADYRDDFLIPLAQEDYNYGIAALQKVLDQWPAEYASFLGPSCPDYLRFQIGMLYAWHNQVPQAHTVLQSLVISPTNSITPTIAKAARAFLEDYVGAADIYQSCLAAIDVAARAEGDYTAWDWRESRYLCDLHQAFPMVAVALRTAQLADPVGALEAKGVSVQNSIHLDLDGDGKKDWIVVLKRADSKFDAWALLNRTAGWQTRYLHIAKS